MKRILVTVIFSAVAAGSAVAADLPQPPPPQAPAAYVPTPVPVYNWGGIYFGVNGGWGFGQSDWTVATTPPISTGNFNVSGGLVGATLGAQWQSDIWVGGVEGDFDGSWIKGTTNVCVTVACETHNDWLSTIRLRGGIAADRVLFYVTGGGAFGDVRANVNGTAWEHETKAGWTAGAGVEAAFADNWTARVEYLFVDLQNAAFNPPAIPVTVKFSNTNLVRVGVDYKFR